MKLTLRAGRGRSQLDCSRLGTLLIRWADAAKVACAQGHALTADGSSAAEISAFAGS